LGRVRIGEHIAKQLAGDVVDGEMQAGDHPVLADAPRTFDAVREYLRSRDIEGIVWHHADGRMVKIKGKDFGLRRG